MNKTRNYDFTIIVPVFNEEDNIARLSDTLQNYLSSSKDPQTLRVGGANSQDETVSRHVPCKKCVLFVNDGSTDNSFEKIKNSCKEHQDFYYISYKENGGLSCALKAGIDATESPYVGYMDADLQTTPEDFDLLLPFLKDYALVTGIRAKRKDSPFKKIESKIANGFRRMMTHDGMEDTGCPLKVMRTEYAKRVPFFTGMHRFLPALILLQHGKIKQIPVRHFPRMAGTSKYHLWNRLVAPFMDCFAYRWMKKRYINYHINNDNIEVGA